MVKKSILQKHGLITLKAYAFEFTDFDTKEENEANLISYNEDYYKFPSIMNIGKKVVKTKSKNFVLAFSRTYEYPPLKEIGVLSYDNFQLIQIHHEDPFTHMFYEPIVIDNYPVKKNNVDISEVNLF